MDEDGHAVALRPNSAVPEAYLWQIRNATLQGASFHDAVSQLRQSQVPPGYEPHPFRTGVPETLLDTLRSVLATCIYRWIYIFLLLGVKGGRSGFRVGVVLQL